MSQVCAQRFEGLRSSVWDSGFRFSGLVCRIQGLGSGATGVPILAYRVSLKKYLSLGARHKSVCLALRHLIVEQCRSAVDPLSRIYRSGSLRACLHVYSREQVPRHRIQVSRFRILGCRVYLHVYPREQVPRHRISLHPQHTSVRGKDAVAAASDDLQKLWF